MNKPLPGQFLHARIKGRITVIDCYGFCIQGGDENTVHFKDNDGKLYIKSLDEFEWEASEFNHKCL